MVFLGPEPYRIADIAAHHIPLGGHVVAAAGAVRPAAVLVHPVIIRGGYVVEEGILRVIGVVVYHVHDDADARLMHSLYHLLALAYPHAAVIRVGGVGALGYVIVLRVIAPVVLRILGIALVDGGKVIEGIYLYVIHPELLKIS